MQETAGTDLSRLHPARPEPTARSKPSRALLIALAIVALDQVTKAAVRQAMQLWQSIPVVPGVFHLTYVRNTGAAFGIFPEQQWLFIAVTAGVVGLVLLLLWTGRPDGMLARVALGMQLGGALGNLMDRLALGRVTDFLDFRIWPVFNVADSSIVVGAALLMIAVVWHPRAAGGAPAAGGARAGDPGTGDSVS